MNRESDNPPESFLQDSLSDLMQRDVAAEWAADWIGREIDSYRLESLIGYGSYGVVFRAVRTDPYEQTVAIKLMPFRTGGPALTRRFQEECQALADLNHPGIAGILNAGVTSDHIPWLVMRLVDGCPIDDYVQSRHADWNTIAQLLADVAAAVEFAHTQGIVHCDLKPDNILVTSAGQVAVTDFGLAVRLDQMESGLVRSSWSPGTVGYSAPEMIASRQHASKSVDVYSMGAVLYKLLTGQTPHGQQGWLESLIATVKDNPVPINELNPAVPPSLIAVCERCLARDPDLRYSSVAELKADLLIFARGGQISAVADPVRSRARGRQRLQWLGGITAGCAMVVAIVLAVRSQPSGRTGVLDPPEAGLDSDLALAAKQRTNQRMIDHVLKDQIRPAVQFPKQLGDLDRQFLQLTEAKETMEDLLLSSPDDPKVIRRTGDANYLLAVAAHRLRRLPESLASYQRAEQLFETLRFRKLEDQTARFSIFSVRLAMATTVTDTAESHRLNGEALQMIEQLASENPGSLDYSDALATTLLNLANYESLQQDVRRLKESTSLAERALTIARSNCRQTQARPMHRKPIVAAAEVLRTVAAKSGNHRDAFRWSGVMRDEGILLTQEFRDPECGCRLFYAHTNCARDALNLGEVELARQSVTAAISLLTDLRQVIADWDDYEMSILGGLATIEHDVAAAERGDLTALQSSVSAETPLLLIRVTPGEFVMGSQSTAESGPSSDCERPAHTVQLTRGFQISRCEISVAQFREFVDSTDYVTEAEQNGLGSRGLDVKTGELVPKPDLVWRSPGFFQTDAHPVVCVSWNDAQEYCRWLSGISGRNCRLPTEAEWEYCCRAGSTTTFSTGNAAESLEASANCGDQSLTNACRFATEVAARNDKFPFTNSVGNYKANAFGLHDLHGNVEEWCSDWYDCGYYPKSPETDPAGPVEPATTRVVRGGSWYSDPMSCRSAARHESAPTTASTTTGFRVVVE